jgi:hypothetical protein
VRHIRRMGPSHRVLVTLQAMSLSAQADPLHLLRRHVCGAAVCVGTSSHRGEHVLVHAIVESGLTWPVVR